MTGQMFSSPRWTGERSAPRKVAGLRSKDGRTMRVDSGWSEWSGLMDCGREGGREGGVGESVTEREGERERNGAALKAKAKHETSESSLVVVSLSLCMLRRERSSLLSSSCARGNL